VENASTPMHANYGHAVVPQATIQPGHWWAGFPGAFCLKCGQGCATELAVADGWYDPVSCRYDTPEHEAEVRALDGFCPADLLTATLIVRPDGGEPHNLGVDCPEF
jgi:hypothetical protein